MCFSLACVLPLDALLLDLLRNYVIFFLPDLKKTKQRTIKKKNWSIVPPCGHVWHYTGVFMTALMNDQDMSVLFHCVPANFAPMSTFLKATVMNKEMSLISTNHGFCFLWIVILSNSHIHMNLEFAGMSGTKFNIRLHFVFLQSQWFYFCLSRQQQQTIPQQWTTTVMTVRAQTRSLLP